MIKEKLPDLTKPEFSILKILWKKGKLRIREVHDEISGISNWAYSTTKTTMDRMVKKGLLRRNEFHGIYLYEALVSRPKGFARFIQFFADRILELDYGTVVALFAKSDALTDSEVKEIKTLLAETAGPDKK